MTNDIFSGIKTLIQDSIPPQPPFGKEYQATCVFLLLYQIKHELTILGIQKTDTKGYPWRNQVALPGGHVEPEDNSPKEAVFRELQEEVAILPNQVELLGTLGHFQTINQKDIEVFVGSWDKSGPLNFDATEISRILEIPFKTLLKTHLEKKFHDRRLELDVTSLRYPLEDVEIWGVTAKILYHFIELLHPRFQT